MAKKATAKNVVKVLENLVEFLKEQDSVTRKVVAREANDFIDQLSTYDMFGTEGQLDPRGDQRD